MFLSTAEAVLVSIYLPPSYLASVPRERRLQRKRFPWKRFFSLQCGSEAFQQQSIECHAERAHRHEKRSQLRAYNKLEKWIKESRANRDASHVVAEGPKQILFNLAHRSLGYLHSDNHVSQILLDEDDMARFFGYIGAGSNGDPHIGLGKRRSVVDAITYHRHLLSFGLQLFNLLGFILREDFSQNTIDLDLSANRLGRPFVVACNHQNLEPQAVKLLDGFDGVILQRVGHRNDAHQFSIRRDKHGRFAIVF